MPTESRQRSWTTSTRSPTTSREKRAPETWSSLCRLERLGGFTRSFWSGFAQQFLPRAEDKGDEVERDRDCRQESQSSRHRGILQASAHHRAEEVGAERGGGIGGAREQLRKDHAGETHRD